MTEANKYKIGVIGLGYVGLPLAAEFGRFFETIGLDINEKRISSLRKGKDLNKQVSLKDIKKAKFLSFSTSIEDLADCNTYIITVPTPVDEKNIPDLEALKLATRKVSEVLSIGDIIIYESTVYPGVTEEICVPILETNSGLTLNNDFFCGYSPERINPGDKERNLTGIVKITSGSNTYAANFVDTLYSKIIKAGTFKAKNIRVAEASKVIENIQRDVNIALVNELSIVFNKMNISIYDVLEAAETKWNFIKMSPGLVGGHCISVDPYYLSYKSSSLGYSPNLTLTAREVNNSMAKHICDLLIDKMVEKEIKVKKSKILIMGLTFKENCSDMRNTKVVNVSKILSEYGCLVEVFDPIADYLEAKTLMGENFITEPAIGEYDCILVLVEHDKFISMGIDKIRSLGKENSIVFSLKNSFPKGLTDLSL